MDRLILGLPAEVVLRGFLCLLILCRFSGLMLTAPFFGAENVPVKVKGACALLLSLCCTPLLPLPQGKVLATSSTAVGVVLLCAGEVLVGVLFGLAVSLFFAAVQFAGQVLAQQIGLALAGVIDPITSVRVSSLGQLKYILAVGVFVAANLHLELIAVLRRSFDLVPVGSTLMWPQVAEILVRGLGGTMWTFALRLALPGMVGLLLVTVGLGFLARSVPEINIFIVGFGLQALVGMYLLYLAVPLLVDLFRQGAVWFVENASGLLTWTRGG